MTQIATLRMSLLCCLAFAACGSGDAPVAREGAPTGAGNASSAVLVDPDMGDFPIPAPSGALREPMSIQNGRVIMYPAGDLQRVVDFYDAWTASEVAAYRRFGEKSINWDNSGPEGESPTRTIFVAPDADGEKPIIVTLSAI